MNPVLLIGSFPGTVAYANPSGWMDSDLFVKYLEHFVKCARPRKESPVLLILDGHASHKSLRAINFCRDNGIYMVTLPPHTSNKPQPLDVAVYGPFKSYISQEMDKYMTNHPGERITDYVLGSLVKESYIRAFTPNNIMKGFQRSGMSPYNPDIFTDDDFLGASAVISTNANSTSSPEPGPSTSQCRIPSVDQPDSAKRCVSPESRSSSIDSDPSCQKEVNVTDISPLPKPKEKSQSKGGRKQESSEEITASPYK